MKSVKFKSGVSPLIYLALIIYHISIIVLLFLPIFLYADVTTRLGVSLLIINVVYLYPLIFNTYYTLEENELFIYQWPFIRKKIKYANIFEITDTLPEGIKKVKRVSLSTPKFFIGYYSYEMDKDTKKEVKTKNYIEISPKDVDLFMIKMGGKFKMARDLAAKLEEEHNKKNAEHLRKKSIADEIRKEKEAENKPVDIVVSSVKKNNAKVKIEETEE